MYKKTSMVFALFVILALLSPGCAPAATPEVVTEVIKETQVVTQVVEVEKQVEVVITPTPLPVVKKIKAAFVLSGSISDGAFTTIGYQALQAMKQEPFIEKVDYIEGISSATDAAKAMRDYIAEGYDVIWAHSGAFGVPGMELAPEFPETTFVLLAFPPEDKTFDNVWFSLSEYEGAYYVVGALAAKMTQSNVIGFVGGRENPLYTACSMAYEEGAKSVNPDINVLKVFTGDFNDPVKAKEASVSQIQSGADVLVHIQSLGTSGVFAAAEEADHQVWVIGKDNDQFSIAPDVVLTSVVIDYRIQMEQILQQIADGNRSGSLPQSIKSGAVYLADFYGRVPPDVVSSIEDLTKKVINGEVEYTTQYDL